MIRQYYFPKARTERPGWLLNFAGQLAKATEALALPAEDVAAAANDARFLAYVYGPWLARTRDFGPACTAAAQALGDDPGEEPFVLPVFTPPPLPDGVAPVPPGALQRVFAFVQRLKAAPGYTEAIGLQLGVIGAEAATENPVPTFTLSVERGEAGEFVRVSFLRFGQPGVAIQGRRGGGGWEDLAISLKSPWLDRRPLLVPGQPEVREYRMQFFSGSAPAGDFTPVAGITVSP